MNISPEQKKAIEQQKAQCVYCKIVKGEIPGKKFFEDNKTLAIVDIYPACKGHCVFLFKEHYPLPAFIPPDEFKHFFGLVPGLSKGIKGATVRTGINLFLASGGVAGQTFPHTLVHFFPREAGDGFFNFLFKRKASTPKESSDMLGNNLPIMMSNHFKRNPAPWHTGAGERPLFLQKVAQENPIAYEDEKVLAIFPKKAAVEGHIEIYSKEEEKYIENLSEDSSSHFFFAASFAATAVFEGLGAHGTNFVMQSGESDDNPQGRLIIHVFPRKQEDALAHMHWKPKQTTDDLDALASKIKDKTWKLSHKEKKKEAPKAIAPPTMVLGAKKETKKKSPEDEIANAIKIMQD